MMLSLRALPLRADKCGPRLVGTVSVGGSSAASVASSFDPTALQFSSIFRACLNYESNSVDLASCNYTWSCHLRLINQCHCLLNLSRTAAYRAP